MEDIPSVSSSGPPKLSKSSSVRGRKGKEPVTVDPWKRPLSKEASKYMHSEFMKGQKTRTPEGQKSLKEKYDNLRKIELYKTFFGTGLKYNKKINEESPPEAVEAEVRSLSDQNSIPGSVIACKQLIIFLMKTAEEVTSTVWNPFGVNLDHFADYGTRMIEEGQMLKTEIPELAIHYNRLFCQTPLTRAFVQCFYLAQLVNRLNKAGIMEETLNKKVTKEVEKEYSDL